MHWHATIYATMLKTQLLLVPPNTKYKDSFLAALLEYQQENLKDYNKLDYKWLKDNFSEYVTQKLAEANCESLPEGYVPHTLLWLVDGTEYIGRVDIRHALTDQLRAEGGHIGYDIRPSQRRKGYGKTALMLGLKKAKELGLQEVLVTCDIGNAPSNKIIQANGGTLIDSSTITNKNRYKIPV